jgi:hypothetical protein
LPDSGDTVPDSGQTGRSSRVSCNLAGKPAGSGQNGWTPGIWPDPAVLAESPASQAGILPERPVSGQLAEILPFSVEFRQKWPDSGNFAGICICQILKKYFYINIFYFVNKIYLF